MTDIQGGLTLEQRFKLTTLKSQIAELSEDQAKEYLIELFRQSMVKDNLVKNLLKQ